MSTTYEPGTLVLLGSGPGIGVSVASHFAQQHFKKIILISRDASRLETDKTTVEAAAREANKSVSIETKSADIADSNSLKKALSEAEKAGPVECVYFNAARVAPSTLLEESVDNIEFDFKVQNSALYTTAIWAIPLLQKFGEKNPSSSPSLLVTNSLLYKNPLAFVFSLCMAKSAQRTLVRCLNETYGKEVHIGLISVEGQVSPDKSHMSPKFIAGKAWELFAQPRGSWGLEVEVLEK